jgi:hypothetical protein
VTRRERLEAEIRKHRPEPGTERLPASRQALAHVNDRGLLERALERQRQRNDEDEVEGPVVITRLVAWEILADSRRGVLEP